MKRVLLTGATGRIGASFFEAMREKYWFRLAARRIEKMGEAGEHEKISLDVADLDACQEACRGIDTVLHLAADPSPASGFYESLLDNNIKGAYNIFRAAKDQGCQRVVYASSIQLIEGYPLDTQAGPDMPTKAVNMYGACKAFAESTAHYFAAKEGLSCLCVRVGNYQGNSDSMVADARRLSAWISERDMNQLFERCIDVEDLPYAILHAVSDNRFKRLDIRSTRELVGYEPQDNSFDFFGTGIDNGARWYTEAPNREQ
jgi:NAD+ dependent glucose-6-phosphate dehydrogenase